MENQTTRPKKRKGKINVKNVCRYDSRERKKTVEDRDTRASGRVASGNVEAKIWANPLPGGGFSYRFRFGQKSGWGHQYFNAQDDCDAILAAKKVRKWILRHKWQTLFGFRR
jgi:hypothetical protein